MSIGRAVERWELPLLRRAEKDGKGLAEIQKLFIQYCEEFKDEREAKADAPREVVELTKAEKAKITRAKNKAKKEADAEVAKLKAEAEAKAELEEEE